MSWVRILPAALAANFAKKIQRLWWPVALDGRALADGVLPRIFFFAIIFGFFSYFHFAECKSLPSAFPALSTRQRLCRVPDMRHSAKILCRLILCRVSFAECISGFAECRRHLAKWGCPVVYFPNNTEIDIKALIRRTKIILGDKCFYFRRH